MADNKFQTPEALARCLPMSRLQAAHGKAAGQRLRRLEFVVCHCVPSLS